MVVKIQGKMCHRDVLNQIMPPGIPLRTAWMGACCCPARGPWAPPPYGGLPPRAIRAREFMPWASLVAFRSLRRSRPLSSSSLTEKALRPSSISPGVAGIIGKCGELPVMSSPRRPPMKLPITLRRFGLMGGTGGALTCDRRFGVDDAAPKRLPDREREPLRDRLPAACSGRFTVGTREVLETKVGSEMSFFLTTRFIESSSRLTAPSSPEVGAVGALRGEGMGPVGVEAPEVMYGDGRPFMGEMGDS